MTKKGKERLDGLTDTAMEAEADPDRHQMEEAILATLAKVKPDDPFADDYSLAYTSGTLTFSRSDLKAVGAALHENICLQGVPADDVLLRDKLRAAGAKVPDAVLKVILDGSKAVDAAVALQYIEKLDRLDKYHALDESGQEYLKAIETIKKKGLSPEEAVPQVLNFLTAHAETTKIIRSYPAEAVAAEGFLDTLGARRADGRDFLGLDCGFRHLNEVLNGLPDGVIILAGAPSCGKTTLAKQIADHVAEVEKVPVLFYSFEQSAEELRIKSLSRLSSVNSRHIWKGRAGNLEWKKVEAAAGEYLQGTGPYLTIIEAGRKDTVEAIRAAAIMAQRKAGGGRVLLVLDYLQIIPAGKEAPDAIREKIDANLSELRRLSRDLKSPVLVVSSQNREAYKENKPPTLAALKESGGIEYSADAVICLWRDKEESERLTEKYKRLTVRVEAHVLKNRNGELSKIKLDFTPEWSLFTERDKEDLDYAAALGE
jgi:replicative DNA helicase